MKMVITGGAGFIGRWVVRKLLRGRHDLWVVDNFSKGSSRNLKEFRHDPRLKDIVRLDIRNGQKLKNLMRRIRPQLCFHLAAQVSVQASLDDPQENFEVNVLGTHQLLEALRPYRSRLLMAGTCLVYKAAQKSIDEESPLEPRSPYAASKLASEELALGYARGYGMPVVVVRPFNTYGPFQRGDSEGGVISIFLNQRKKGKPLFIYGTGVQTRDFLYVEDCADFIVKAAFHPKANGEIFNAGTDRETSIRTLARLIGNGCPIQRIPHHHPEAEIWRLRGSFRKAQQVLGWSPKVKLEEGIRRTAAWLWADGNSSS